MSAVDISTFASDDAFHVNMYLDYASYLSAFPNIPMSSADLLAADEIYEPAHLQGLQPEEGEPEMTFTEAAMAGWREMGHKTPERKGVKGAGAPEEGEEAGAGVEQLEEEEEGGEGEEQQGGEGEGDEGRDEQVPESELGQPAYRRDDVIPDYMFAREGRRIMREKEKAGELRELFENVGVPPTNDSSRLFAYHVAVAEYNLGRSPVRWKRMADLWEEKKMARSEHIERARARALYYRRAIDRWQEGGVTLRQSQELRVVPDSTLYTPQTLIGLEKEMELLEEMKDEEEAAGVDEVDAEAPDAAVAVPSKTPMHVANSMKTQMLTETSDFSTLQLPPEESEEMQMLVSSYEEESKKGGEVTVSGASVYTRIPERCSEPVMYDAFVDLEYETTGYVRAIQYESSRMAFTPPWGPLRAIRDVPTLQAFQQARRELIRNASDIVDLTGDNDLKCIESFERLRFEQTVDRNAPQRHRVGYLADLASCVYKYGPLFEVNELTAEGASTRLDNLYTRFVLRGAAASEDVKFLSIDLKGEKQHDKVTGSRTTFFTTAPGANNNLPELAKLLKNANPSGLQFYRDVLLRVCHLLLRMAWHYYAFMNGRFQCLSEGPRKGETTHKENKPPYLTAFFPHLDDFTANDLKIALSTDKESGKGSRLRSRLVGTALFQDIKSYRVGARALTFRGFARMVITDAFMIMYKDYGFHLGDSDKINRSIERVTTEMKIGNAKKGVELAFIRLGCGVHSFNADGTVKFIQSILPEYEPDAGDLEEHAAFEVKAQKGYKRTNAPGMDDFRLKWTAVREPTLLAEALTPVFLTDMDPFRPPLDQSTLPGVKSVRLLEEKIQQLLTLDCLLAAGHPFIMRTPDASLDGLVCSISHHFSNDAGRLDAVLWSRLNMKSLKYQVAFCGVESSDVKPNAQGLVMMEAGAVKLALVPSVSFEPVRQAPGPREVRDTCALSFISTPIMYDYMTLDLNSPVLRERDIDSVNSSSAEWFGLEKKTHRHPIFEDVAESAGAYDAWRHRFFQHIDNPLEYAPDIKRLFHCSTDQEARHETVGLFRGLDEFYHRHTMVVASKGLNEDHRNVVDAFDVYFDRLRERFIPEHKDQFQEFRGLLRCDRIIRAIHVLENGILQKSAAMNQHMQSAHMNWMLTHLKSTKINIKRLLSHGRRSQPFPIPAYNMDFTKRLLKVFLPRCAHSDQEQMAEALLNMPWTIQYEFLNDWMESEGAVYAPHIAALYLQQDELARVNGPLYLTALLGGYIRGIPVKIGDRIHTHVYAFDPAELPVVYRPGADLLKSLYASVVKLFQE